MKYFDLIKWPWGRTLRERSKSTSFKEQPVYYHLQNQIMRPPDRWKWVSSEKSKTWEDCPPSVKGRRECQVQVRFKPKREEFSLSDGKRRCCTWRLVGPQGDTLWWPFQDEERGGWKEIGTNDEKPSKRYREQVSCQVPPLKECV